MSNSLPPEILVTELPHGMHYRLPYPPGVPRAVSIILIFSGIFPIGLAVVGFFILLLFAARLDLTQFLFFTAMCAGPVMFGWPWLLFACSLAGRTEIELTPDEIRVVRRLGPIRRTKRRSLHQVRQFALGEASSWSSSDGLVKVWGALRAVCEDAPTLDLACGYPRQWMQALADELTDRCRQFANLSETRASIPDPLDTGWVMRFAKEERPSRGWRPGMGIGRRIVRVVGGILCGGFLAFGCLYVLILLVALVQGEFQELTKDALLGWLCLASLPTVIGAGGLRYLWTSRRTASRSPEHNAAEHVSRLGPDEQREAVAPSGGRSGRDYPTLPADPAPGAELTARLSPRAEGVSGVLVLLVLFVLCSGWLTAGVNVAIQEGVHGGVLCSLPFVVAAWLPLAYVLARKWLRWTAGKPVVEVSGHPVYPGQCYQIGVTLRGPLRLRRLQVTLVCEEEASYRDEGNTRREIRRTHMEELWRREDLVIRRGTPFHIRLELRVPPAAMHSFEAKHNQVRWLVRVEGDVPWRPRYEHESLLVVYPPRGRGGDA